ncbi:MAG: DUF4236 domain-containing protein, partial [Erysipelotrichaceae bacterium]|nr:DUF4236 domain-containing protein [Erysipelotrichaceae bacterium]
IANGVRLNVGRSGVSLTLGKKGVHYTINSNGKSTATVGLPGTGVSYSKRFDVYGGLKKFFEGDDKKTRYIESTNEVVPVNNDDEEKLGDFNEYVRSIKSFHKKVSDPIEWDTLASASVPEDVKEEDRDMWESTLALAKKVVSKDVDSYLKVMKEYSPMEEISAFGNDFEFGNDESGFLACRFNVKIKEVVPSVGFKKSDKTGRISQYEIKGSQYNDLAQDYVCSCTIRIAREAFSLTPADVIVVNAEDVVFDPSTGNSRDATILSVLFVKEGFNDIKFEMIDPSDFVGRFRYNMSFTKSGGFKEVKEISIPKLKK